MPIVDSSGNKNSPDYLKPSQTQSFTEEGGAAVVPSTIPFIGSISINNKHALKLA